MISLLEYQLYGMIGNESYGPFDYKHSDDAEDKNYMIGRAYGITDVNNIRCSYVDIYNEEDYVARIIFNESSWLARDEIPCMPIIEAIDDIICKYERSISYNKMLWVQI